MNRISDALSSGDGLTNIKGIIDAVQSGDWATAAKMLHWVCLIAWIRISVPTSPGLSLILWKL